MSAEPPPPEPPARLPPDAPEALRCPRCSAEVAPDQGWCLECGAPARTRLAPTPNWQLPTAAIAAIVLVAGALLAFAFVNLTGDDAAAPVSTTPAIATQPPAAPPAVQTATTPTATTPTQTAPAPGTTTLPPVTVPGQPPPPNQPPRTATSPRAGGR